MWTSSSSLSTLSSPLRIPSVPGGIFRGSPALAGCLLLVLWLTFGAPAARAQADNDQMSQAEIETLRDSAYVPLDRIHAYEKILDSREKRMEDLLAKPRRPGFALDMHDAIDQFGAVADELNDNLDDYQAKHRDVRKALPKLVEATERWSTTLRATGADDRYNVVQRTALDALTDMRSTAQDMQVTLTAYFKDHPEALKAEKQRSSNPHAPDAGPQ